MLKLRTDISLSNRSLGFLKRWQKIIDDELTYEDQIKKAKATWGKNNKTFDEIKDKLRQMLNRTHRCSYCEDSKADEIEHIYPKDIFPEKTFVWINYLYACGPCNGPKSNKFALIEGAVLRNITPPRPLPPDFVFTKPPVLPAALIDPRIENPTHFIGLDIIGTFRFFPADDLNPIEILRADYTIELLKLNDREELIDARKIAYGNYRARLSEYILQKNNGANQSKLNELIEDIKDENHPTVWFEMKRNHQFIPELSNLFNKAPEALTW